MFLTALAMLLIALALSALMLPVAILTGRIPAMSNGPPMEPAVCARRVRLTKRDGRGRVMRLHTLDGKTTMRNGHGAGGSPA